MAPDPAPKPSRGRLQSLSPAQRGLLGALGLIVVAAAIAWGVLSLTGALDHPDVEVAEVLDAGAGTGGDPGKDPFAWERSRQADFERRAMLGNSHVLYEVSPGGAVASAKRTAAFDDDIAQAAKDHGVDPDTMEAMVFLESAGRPEVIAGGTTDVTAAAGLGQIVAQTGTDFLGMSINVPRSQELTDEITTSLATAQKLNAKASRLGAGDKKQRKQAAKYAKQAQREEAEAERARRARIQIDDRFNPLAALDAMGLYLEKAKKIFGRDDLAVASYHMGIGNLETVIRDYAEQGGLDTQGKSVGEIVADNDLSYAQLYFDTSPLTHQKAYDVLASFEDDSPTYLWRVLAARQIMSGWHDDRSSLSDLATLYTNKATSEEVFHPQEETRTFDDPGELQDGLDSGELVAIPKGPEYCYRVGPQLGELTKQLGVDRSLYEALRPEALATLIYMTSRVQAITGKHSAKDDLIVTSAVRDQEYQDALVGSNPEATPEYSLHTTGYSFDILRDYASDKEAVAFQFVLDRMKALGVIDYAVEPQAIHVTVSDLARPLLDD
jgi:hypothetical protein